MKKVQLRRVIRFQATEVVVVKEYSMDVIPNVGESLGFLPICDADVVNVLHGRPLGYLTLFLSELCCDSEEAVELLAILHEDEGWGRVTQVEE